MMQVLALTEVNIDGNLLWLNFSIKNHVRNTEVKRTFSYSKALTIQSRTYNLKEEKDNSNLRKCQRKGHHGGTITKESS